MARISQSLLGTCDLFKKQYGNSCPRLTVNKRPMGHNAHLRKVAY